MLRAGAVAMQAVPYPWLQALSFHDGSKLKLAPTLRSTRSEENRDLVCFKLRYPGIVWYCLFGGAVRLTFSVTIVVGFLHEVFEILLGNFFKT